MTSMTTMTNRPSFPLSEAVHKGLQSFAGHMASSATVRDGVLAARVVGEFSAGKTRLLRELFSDALPTALLPVSSLERQTRLQLEITWDTAPGLALIERASDQAQGVEIRRLDRFPLREELEDADPMRHRLRLGLPDQRLFLPTGDGYTDDQEPQRLFLIDTPGWNSGDDALAEIEADRVLGDFYNLALIYVTDARRLDSLGSQQRLREFLAALESAEFIGQHALLFVITHCPPEDAARLGQRARERVLQDWQDLGRDPEDLLLNLFCVEFQSLTPSLREDFRRGFWQALLAPLDRTAVAPDPWVSAISRWSPDWSPARLVHHTNRLIGDLRGLLDKACRGNEFIAGMNRYRLIGLDSAARSSRLHEAWLRQIECSAEDLTVLIQSAPPLPGRGHPMAVWAKDYWHQRWRDTVGPTLAFVAHVRIAIGNITADTEDLQAVLTAELQPLHEQAIAALDSSFTRLIAVAQTSLISLEVERQVATLLTLSLLEARYHDHYQRAQESA